MVHLPSHSRYATHSDIQYQSSRSSSFSLEFMMNDSANAHLSYQHGNPSSFLVTDFCLNMIWPGGASHSAGPSPLRCCVTIVRMYIHEQIRAVLFVRIPRDPPGTDPSHRAPSPFGGTQNPGMEKVRRLRCHKSTPRPGARRVDSIICADTGFQ